MTAPASEPRPCHFCSKPAGTHDPFCLVHLQMAHSLSKGIASTIDQLKLRQDRLTELLGTMHQAAYDKALAEGKLDSTGGF